ERERLAAAVAGGVRGTLAVAAPQVLARALLVQDAEPVTRRTGVERRPAVALRVADRELVRVGVALRVPVEELAEERAAGPVDLRDEDERLAHRDEVVE